MVVREGVRDVIRENILANTWNERIDDPLVEITRYIDHYRKGGSDKTVTWDGGGVSRPLVAQIIEDEFRDSGVRDRSSRAQ